MTCDFDAQFFTAEFKWYFIQLHEKQEKSDERAKARDEVCLLGRVYTTLSAWLLERAEA